MNFIDNEDVSTTFSIPYSIPGPSLNNMQIPSLPSTQSTNLIDELINESAQYASIENTILQRTISLVQLMGENHAMWLSLQNLLKMNSQMQTCPEITDEFSEDLQLLKEVENEVLALNHDIQIQEIETFPSLPGSPLLSPRSPLLSPRSPLLSPQSPLLSPQSIEVKTTEAKEKPYFCSECRKSFKYIGNWRRHRFVHSVTKPFQCPFPECARQYARTANLKNHLRFKHNLTIKSKRRRS